ncbi:MAG: hypothetical protein AB7H43_13665 [Acidimicrobiia bacterium]
MPPPPHTFLRPAPMAAVVIIAWVIAVLTVGMLTPATAGPWRLVAQPARVIAIDAPVYAESPDGWWACGWGFHCRPTAAREPGDPPPTWRAARGGEVTLTCQFGAYAKIETTDRVGWIAATAVRTRIPLRPDCNALNL